MTHEPIEPKRQWWRRWLPVAAVVVLVAVSLVTGTSFYLKKKNEAIRKEREQSRICTDKVIKFEKTEECVGITDGAHVFELYKNEGQDTSIAKVMQLIKAQNDEVPKTKGSLWFSVAYVLPMPWKGEGTYPAKNVVDQLYGAYAAQEQANKDTNLKMRLLVANTGHDGVAWEQVANDLIKRRQQDRIAAVAGLGPSSGETPNLVDRLSKAGIPMVGATITADNLNGKQYPHLRRVSPTNADEVAVGAKYLQDLGGTDKVDAYLLTVKSEDDGYVETLEDKFRRRFGDNLQVDPALDPKALGHDGALKGRASHFCRRGKQVVVYFAGRAESLKFFMTELENQCDTAGQSMMTVLSGDDASALVGSFESKSIDKLKKRNIYLYYAGLTHTKQWKSEPVELRELRQVLARVGADAVDLDAGGAIMAYDAVSVAIEAVRIVDPKHEELEKLDSLKNGFSEINDREPHCGASGPIAFSSDEEREGDTVNKPIPIVPIIPAKDKAVELRYLTEDGKSPWGGKCGQ